MKYFASIRTLLLFIFCIVGTATNGQTVAARLDAAWKKFMADAQMKYAIAGFCVLDAKTGKPVFERNARVGLAPASTQKIITSVAAYEMLGKEYRYQTIFRTAKGSNSGEAVFEVIGSGDPTFGSWRFSSTRDSVIAKAIMTALKNRKEFPSVNELRIPDYLYGNPMPGGFTWEDMGNYYGAGSRQLNWHENQFDIYFDSENAATNVTRISPAQSQASFRNLVEADPSVKGDEILVVSAPGSNIIYLEGKMPVNKKNFVVSGSMPDPAFTFAEFLQQVLGRELRITMPGRESLTAQENTKQQGSYKYDTIYVHQSPPLDSINYYFLRRSVNLYGESLIKQVAAIQKERASTEQGVKRIRCFFAGKGFDDAAINIHDGSGLSPQNRVTTSALAAVLQYAKGKPWYQSFYHALPEFNGMKMKSGSISGARAYAGYHRATDGKEYTFSIIVNNFDGSAGEVVKKIYKLLDNLK
jgi:serine-type D-Ala-D-Ala carboxypeptidase/endopeptidase (penicillin-binding protein 4)